jgi:hypothetical protein
LNPGPKISEIFLHFAGDSTITRFIDGLCKRGFMLALFIG